VGNTIQSCGVGIVAGTDIDREGYPYHVTVSGNSIADSFGSGILISRISLASITGNLVRNWNRAEHTNKMLMAGIALRRSVTDAVVSDNIVSDFSGRQTRVGIIEMEAGDMQSSGNAILHNVVRGVGTPYALMIRRADKVASRLDRSERFTEEPASGSWRAGDRAEAADASAGARKLGWVCESSGTFNAIDTRVVGSLRAGSPRATLASTAGIWDGMRLRIAGAGPEGSDFVDDVFVQGPDTIAFISGKPATTTVGARVTNVKPTFRPY
jgi:hypothetical protein